MGKYKMDDMNWLEIGEHLKEDCRIVVPLGSIEEHGYLSIATDTLFTETVANDACCGSGVLMSRCLPFGCSHFSINFPGTISLRTRTLCLVVEDIVDSLFRQGFRRIVLISGHGGNTVLSGKIEELHLDRPNLNIYFYYIWDKLGPYVTTIETENGWMRGNHASWIEVQPFTKIAAIPNKSKKVKNDTEFPIWPLNARTARKHLGDGVIGGEYDIDSDEIKKSILTEAADGFRKFLFSLPKTESKD